MNTRALPYAVTLLADAIAANIPEDGQLALLSALVSQLGVALATIAALRATSAQQNAQAQGNSTANAQPPTVPIPPI